MTRLRIFDDKTIDTLLEIARKYRSGLLGGFSTRQPAVHSEYSGGLFYLDNDSGEEIPAYACCQVTGTTEIGGQNYLQVDKPVDTDGTSGWFLFNSHTAIPIDEQGISQKGPVVRAYKNSGTVTAGDAWRPTSGQWYITSGSGSFVAIGADDIGTNVLKIFTGSSASSATKLVQTPGGGIAARSGTTVTAATCTEFKIISGTLTTNTSTISVYNPWPVAIPASFYIVATQEKISGFWIANFPGVINVSWADPVLKQTWDGTNYSTIDTAIDCT